LLLRRRLEPFCVKISTESIDGLGGGFASDAVVVVARAHGVTSKCSRVARWICGYVDLFSHCLYSFVALGLISRHVSSGPSIIAKTGLPNHGSCKDVCVVDLLARFVGRSSAGVLRCLEGI
jgi:hypothetical protein